MVVMQILSALQHVVLVLCELVLIELRLCQRLGKRLLSRTIGCSIGGRIRSSIGCVVSSVWLSNIVLRWWDV